MTAPPPPLDAGGLIATQMYAEWAAALYPFNLTGHPAIEAPAGLADGNLPVGLQLVGPWFAEARLLDLASCLGAERAQLWPPGASGSVEGWASAPLDGGWLGREESNLRMTESKSVALPLGDAPSGPL